MSSADTPAADTATPWQSYRSGGEGTSHRTCSTPCSAESEAPRPRTTALRYPTLIYGRTDMWSTLKAWAWLMLYWRQ